MRSESPPTDQEPTDAADWQEFVGLLKTSPNWQGDPQAVQEAMRCEWDGRSGIESMSTEQLALGSGL
jgi:hypothetical protein